ncbi:MAG: recombination protein O N-terminal domain-containing protein [Victivallales bacterium]|nr:recombination protein O N-terminal domain-containing protein [Victivallales bacterium]
MSEQLETVNVLVLRKLPYRESSLILGTVSAEFGKLDFIARGARKLSKKQFPAFDLFREVQVTFRPLGKDTLHTAANAELISSNDALANIPENFEAALKIGDFILRNSAGDLPSPLVYEALKHIFRNWALAGEHRDFPWSREQCSVIIKASYLYENGLLPDFSIADDEKSRKQQQLIDAVIECGNEGKPLPQLPAEWWLRLNKWLNGLIRENKLKY